MFSLALQDCLSAEVAEPSVVEKERESLVSTGVWRWLKKVSMGCNWLMQLIKVSLRAGIYHSVRSKLAVPRSVSLHTLEKCTSETALHSRVSLSSFHSVIGNLLLGKVENSSHWEISRSGN
jgi:hypothetical protein